MLLSRIGCLLAVAAAPLVSCAPNETRPPRADTTCEGASCARGSFNGGTVAGGGAGGRPPQEAGAAGVAGTLPAVDLVISVSEISSEPFDAATPLAVSADVLAKAAGGGSVRVTVPALGSAVLEGVAAARSSWFTIFPAGQGVLPTVEPVDTTSSGTLTLVAVDAAPVDTALLSLNPPLEREPGLAQMLVFVVDDHGDPVAGITLEHPTAQAVAYSASGFFGASATETDASGLVLIANVPALEVPQASGFVLRGPDTESSAAGEVLADAVTIVRVEI